MQLHVILQFTWHLQKVFFPIISTTPTISKYLWIKHNDLLDCVLLWDTVENNSMRWRVGAKLVPSLETRLYWLWKLNMLKHSVALAQQYQTKRTAKHDSAPVSCWLIHIWFSLCCLMHEQHVELDVIAVQSCLKCCFFCVWHLSYLILTLDLPMVNTFQKDAQLEWWIWWTSHS